MALHLTKTDKFPGRMGQCLEVVSSRWSAIKAEMSLAHDTAVQCQLQHKDKDKDKDKVIKRPNMCYIFSYFHIFISSYHHIILSCYHTVIIS